MYACNSGCHITICWSRNSIRWPIRVLVSILVVETNFNVTYHPISFEFRNLPCGLAPGIGLSTFLTYGLVMRDGLTIAQAFTSVLTIFLFHLMFHP